MTLWLVLMIFRDCKFSIGSLNYSGIGKRIFKLAVKDIDSRQEIKTYGMIVRNYFFIIPVFYLLLFPIVIKPFYDLTIGKIFTSILFLLPKGDYLAFYHLFSSGAWVVLLLFEMVLMLLNTRPGDYLANSKVTNV